VHGPRRRRAPEQQRQRAVRCDGGYHELLARPRDGETLRASRRSSTSSSRRCAAPSCRARRRTAAGNR
jgi:hypothetical protein